jgi:inner membrane protein
MDSITHLVLGASLGEILAGERNGKKAMLIGAIAQSIPDIDFIGGLWMSPAQYFLAHRGFTHSFLFVALASLLFPLSLKYFRTDKSSYILWALFFAVQLTTHVLLDSLNAYGVGWFEPFSHQRISFDVLFVADPWYTIWLAIACVVLMILRSRSTLRIRWAIAGITFSSLYIVYAMSNKGIVEKQVENVYGQHNNSDVKFLSTPTPMNSWLWYVVIPSSNGYFIEYRSVFDRDLSVPRHYIAKNDALLDPFRNETEALQLTRLARGFYALEQHGDTVTFNNLRFGQVNGWENPAGSFIFHYNLGKSGNSLLTVQQGRFSGWSKKTVAEFVKRMEGN